MSASVQSAAADPPYRLGSTLLVRIRGHKLLEPVIVEALPGKSPLITVRQLIRRTLLDPTADSNQLIYSERLLQIPITAIVRRCHIRIYTDDDVRVGKVPTVYQLGGTADCWILSDKKMQEDGSVVDMGPQEVASFEAGFDLESLPPDVEPLRTLSLFCGSGNFDRGLGNAGAVQSISANDIDGPAIMTNCINSTASPDQYFWGSVVQYMKHVMDGQYSRAIAAIGNVQLIIASSPCQGFTNMQMFRRILKSVKKASMIALVVAFIELYRPEYAILENVLGLASVYGDDRDQSILSQVVSALVGLGYQAQIFYVNAVNHGACANRDRIFISIAAPGLVPLSPLAASHLPSRAGAANVAGDMPNGLPFGVGIVEKAPHDFVSARCGTADLPPLGAEGLRTCIDQPDHRLSNILNPGWRQVIKAIPHNQGAGTQVFDAKWAFKKGLITPELLDAAISRGLRRDLDNRFVRIDPDLPFDTITTRCDPRNSHGPKKTVSTTSLGYIR